MFTGFQHNEKKLKKVKVSDFQAKTNDDDFAKAKEVTKCNIM